MSGKGQSRPPKYRHYKPKNLAVVRIQGRDHYLGAYESPASYEKYHRLIAEWLSSGVTPNVKSPDEEIAQSRTVNELILAFWQHAEKRYVKNRQPTSEIGSFRTALRPVRKLYGQAAVATFGPLALIACRQELINGGICRKRVNQHVTRIRHMFKWGVARELVQETVWRALCAVEGLRFGEAIETKPVVSVPEQYIAALEKFVSPQIWAMINFQLWTGCRPGEVSSIRTIDIKKEGDAWEYHPESHKTEHHNRQRVIFIGPRAQQIIEPWLKDDPNAYLFSPREARDWHLERRRETRQTPMTPSQRKRSRKKNPKRTPGEKYSTIAYDHAIMRACKRADIPSWAPNRLRHNAATRIRSEFGVESARVILGHASAVTTEIYAEIDMKRAKEIMSKLG